MSNILEIRDLVVSYGGIEAVKNISMDVPEGKIVTLIGANGAGKSTTLKTIAGIVKPKSASIKCEGTEIVGKAPDSIVKSGITLVPEGRKVFANLTVKENLKIGAYLRKDNLTESINYVYDLFPRLKEREWQYAGTLSGGEQQMLAVGRALMSKPKIIMMDEPSLGLAPLVVKSIFDIIRENGFTITRNSNKNVPRMAVFYQNGVHQKIMTLSAYLPYEISILLLEYMITYYMLHESEDIDITIDEYFKLDQETVEIVDEINERLENKMGKLLTQACKYM